ERRADQAQGLGEDALLLDALVQRSRIDAREPRADRAGPRGERAGLARAERPEALLETGVEGTHGFLVRLVADPVACVTRQVLAVVAVEARRRVRPAERIL